jgi:hypothetical protein
MEISREHQKSIYTSDIRLDSTVSGKSGKGSQGLCKLTPKEWPTVATVRVRSKAVRALI